MRTTSLTHRNICGMPFVNCVAGVVGWRTRETHQIPQMRWEGAARGGQTP
jgi:hypothetical protein